MLFRDRGRGGLVQIDWARTAHGFGLCVTDQKQHIRKKEARFSSTDIELAHR